MSARTFSTARKIHLGKDGTLWRLEFDASLNMEQLGLQNWRIVGDGRTPKDQIRDYAKALHGLASREGEDTFLPVSGSSKNNLSSVGVRMTQKISVCRQSQSAAHSPVKEAKETRAPSFARGASPSVVSEFSHAEGPREAKKVMIKDSYSFKIFRLENRERRDRASITELEFQRERDGARPLTRTLIMECHTKENSSELFVLTIDAWTMMQDGAGSLGLYVRDTNRSWIKLWNPSKGYEASVHDALIISRFLELAMILTTSNPTMYINKLLSTSGSDEDEIKRILLKYYDSVVKKFLQLEIVPMSLRNAPTIKNMENFLRRTIEEDASTANASGIKRKHTWESHSNTGSDEVDQELLQKRAAVKSVLMKRKRVVESDSENDSDLEDYVPLSQRDFGFAQRRLANAGDTQSERRKRDLGALDNRLLSPCAAGRPASAAGDKESEGRKKDLGVLNNRLLSPSAADRPTSAACDKESERRKKDLGTLDSRLLSPCAAGCPTSAAGDKESGRRKKDLGALDNRLLSSCAAGRPTSAAGDKESERRKKDLGVLDNRLLSPSAAGRPTSAACDKESERRKKDLGTLDNRLLSPCAASRPTSAACDKESERRKKDLGTLDNRLLSPCAAGRPTSAAGDKESERRKKGLGALDNRLLSPCAAGRSTSAAGDKESERRKKDLGALDNRLLSPCAAGRPTSAAGDKESERTKKDLRALDNRLLSPSAAGRPTSAAGDKESERRKKNLGALDNRLLSPCAAGRPTSAAGDKESERRKKDLGALDNRLLSPCVAGRPTSTASTKGPSRSTRDNQGALGDSAVCAICDDGGELLFCDGECMRYFHASKRVAAQSESHCKSLGYTVEEVQEMGRWLCPNCVDKRHQCFVCGELGRSAGKDPQVFVCDVVLCGRFYHPECLVKWKVKEMQLTKVDKATIIAGLKNKKKDFCCPAHQCRRCGEGETAGGQDNMRKLAKCRRCPKAYHKSCLPRKISFEARDNEPIRAWEIVDENNSVKPIIIYCLDHDMDEALSTPKRDHLKWPNGHFYSLSRFSCN